MLNSRSFLSDESNENERFSTIVARHEDSTHDLVSISDHLNGVSHTIRLQREDIPSLPALVTPKTWNTNELSSILFTIASERSNCHANDHRSLSRHANPVKLQY